MSPGSGDVCGLDLDWFCHQWLVLDIAGTCFFDTFALTLVWFLLFTTMLRCLCSDGHSSAAYHAALPVCCRSCCPFQLCVST